MFTKTMLDLLLVKPKLEYVVLALFKNLFENSKICIFSPQFLYFPRFWNNRGQLEVEICNELQWHNVSHLLIYKHS